MANLDLNSFDGDLGAVRRLVRRSAHVQRAQAMLVSAGLAALGIVVVAGALLTNLF